MSKELNLSLNRQLRCRQKQLAHPFLPTIYASDVCVFFCPASVSLSGYIEAVVIPAGARRIRVVEDKPSHSFLGNDACVFQMTLWFFSTMPLTFRHAETLDTIFVNIWKALLVGYSRIRLLYY